MGGGASDGVRGSREGFNRTGTEEEKEHTCLPPGIANSI